MAVGVTVPTPSGPPAQASLDDKEKNNPSQNAKPKGQVGQGVRVALVALMVVVVVVMIVAASFGRVGQQVQEHVAKHATDGESDEHAERSGADVKVEKKSDDGIARDGDKERAGHRAARHGLRQHGK